MNREESWLYKYNLVKNYYDINGNLLIPSDYVVNGINLNSWLLHQKYLYNNGKLTKEKVDMLQEIGVYFGRSRSLKRKWEVL